jgi:small subunit ribosomal protein S5
MDKNKRKLDEQANRKQKVEAKTSKGEGQKENEVEDITEEVVEDAEKKSDEKSVDATEKKSGVSEGAVAKKKPVIGIKKRGRETGSKEDMRQRRARERYEIWEPTTRLGRLVRSKKITDIGEALATGLPIREPEIVDVLLPELEDEVLDVNMVQRMTDSGRRVRFTITAVIGNKDGYVGIGQAKGKEVGPAIRKAIDNAKMKVVEVKRGCGSWECGCGTPHSFPFQVHGKCGSIRVSFKPAPRGISLAVGDVAKHILKLAGIEDVWGFTTGKTRTTVNYAKAVLDALTKTSSTRTMREQEDELNIVLGKVDK